jgi:hypothetical protein
LPRSALGKPRFPGMCNAEWVPTGRVSPPPELSSGVWYAAKVGVSMHCPRALKGRLMAEMEMWGPASSSSPPPEPSSGVCDTADAGVPMNCTAGAEWVPCRSRIRWTQVSTQTPTRTSSVAGEPHVGCSAGGAGDAAAIRVRSGARDAEGRPRRRRSLNEGPSVRWSLPCGSVCAGVRGLVLAVLVPARSDRLL